MLEAEFDFKRKALIFKATGHAGSEEIGKDLVCASASMLTYDLAQCVKDAHEQGKLAKKPRIEIDSGTTTIVCKPKEEFCGEMSIVFNTISRGFCLLATNYPKYVALKLFGKTYES